MKNQFFLITVFCLISNVTCSMNINLDQVSKDNLIKRAKEENVRRGYWPDDVDVELKEFYLIKDNNKHTANPKYHVRVVGHYSEYSNVDGSFLLVRFGRPTSGYYFKNELNSFGVTLPATQ